MVCCSCDGKNVAMYLNTDGPCDTHINETTEKKVKRGGRGFEEGVTLHGLEPQRTH